MENNKSFKTKSSAQHKKFPRNKKFSRQDVTDRQNRKVRNEYWKLLKKEKRKQPSGEESVDSESSPGPSKTKNKGKGGKINSFTKAKIQYEEKKASKKAKKKENLERKAERDNAFKKYKEKKKLNFQKLCKKNYKGQPIMKNQIEYLLAKIQNSSTKI